MKKYVFFSLAFFTSITFLLLSGTFQPYLIFETQFYQICHTAKAPSIPEHIFKIWKPIWKLILYSGKVKETYFTSVKKAQILSFLRT
jgi:membrane protease YdiL (CAAX protease family)